MKTFGKNFSRVSGFVIGLFLTVLIVGCSASNWGGGYEVVQSDGTISQDSLEVLIKDLD